MLKFFDRPEFLDGFFIFGYIQKNIKRYVLIKKNVYLLKIINYDHSERKIIDRPGNG